MKAPVYHGPGRKAWEDKATPTISAPPTSSSSPTPSPSAEPILHILNGGLHAVTDGRIVGHEALGTIHFPGGVVKTLEGGDRVLVSCTR